MKNKKLTVITFTIALSFFSLLIITGRLVNIGKPGNDTLQYIYACFGIFTLSPIFIGVLMYFASYRKAFIYPLLLMLLPFMFSVSAMMAARFNPFEGNPSIIFYSILFVAGLGAGLVGMIKGNNRYKKENIGGGYTTFYERIIL